MLLNVLLLFPQMACVASALAFYAPYDFRFKRGLEALESYGLRYTATLIAFIVVPLALRIRYYRSGY